MEVFFWVKKFDLIYFIQKVVVRLGSKFMRIFTQINCNVKFVAVNCVAVIQRFCGKNQENCYQRKLVNKNMVLDRYFRKISLYMFSSLDPAGLVRLQFGVFAPRMDTL